MIDDRGCSLSRRGPSRFLFALLLGLGVVGAAGCDEGTYHFGGDFSDDSASSRSVKLTGNVEDIRPPNAVRELVAFAYTNLSAEDLASGPPFVSFRDAGSTVIDDNGDFTLTGLSSGRVTVIFLLDDSEPDGSIDPGDDCSVLVKSGGLKNINGGRVATLKDVEVGFRPEDCQDFNADPPAATCFCSKADEITVTVDRAEEN